MDLYTIIFILVTFLILAGLALFGMFISWLDKKIDRMDRLGGPKKKKEEK